MSQDQHHPLRRYVQNSSRWRFEAIDVLSVREQRRLVWCAVPGRSRIFQIDVGGCQTVSELEDAALCKSGFKRQLFMLRKVLRLIQVY